MKNSTNQPTNFQQVFLSFTRICKYVLTLVVVFYFHLLPAQSLDDFKKSASYDKGVEIIPFSSLRSSASSLAEDVQDLKAEYINASDMDGFTTKKKKLLGSIAGNTKKLNAVKALQADFDFPVDDWIKDEEEANRAINQSNTDLNSLNEKMNDVLNKLNKVMDARRELYKKFEEVITELKKAKSDPSKYIGDNPSEDDVRSLNGYIDEIMENVEKENEAHLKEIGNEENAKKNLETLIGRTEYWK